MFQPLSCRRCLYTTSHALGLSIDAEGICSGCRIHEEKNYLYWPERWSKLQNLVAPYRVANGKIYDCIVPVTGANDSHFVLHLVKERLGMNPLLVNYNKYFNTPLGIRNLANLRIRFNCDMITQNVNPLSVKKITKATLRRFASIYWPCLAGQTVFPVQTAVRYKIPLIIWGAHQGLEQVGMFSHEHEVEMTRRYRKDHDLMGYEADDLLSIFDTLKEADIWQYRYPDDAVLNQIGVRGIYLGNYVRWDPKAQHEQMISTHGYKGARFERTFDTYDHVDCFNFMDLHDHLKLVKHGYSKVTDHASREIRYGRLNRIDGIELVRSYENAPLKHINKFLEWLDIDIKALEFIIDRHRNPLIWKRTAPGERWSRILGETKSNSIPSYTGLELGFKANSEINYSGANSYITIGKGYPL
jgi:N-acetyl sugar amidotransferase